MRVAAVAPAAVRLYVYTPVRSDWPKKRFCYCVCPVFLSNEPAILINREWIINLARFFHFRDLAKRACLTVWKAVLTAVSRSETNKEQIALFPVVSLVYFELCSTALWITERKLKGVYSWSPLLNSDATSREKRFNSTNISVVTKSHC